MSESKLDQITEAMREHVCDHLCRFPWECQEQEQLEEICAGCKMDQFVSRILSQGNGDIEEE